MEIIYSLKIDRNLVTIHTPEGIRRFKFDKKTSYQKYSDSRKEESNARCLVALELLEKNPKQTYQNACKEAKCALSSLFDTRKLPELKNRWNKIISQKARRHA